MSYKSNIDKPAVEQIAGFFDERIFRKLSFELPENWVWCNLSMIGTTNIGLTYRPTDINDEGIMVFRSCNIVNNQLNLNELVHVGTAIRENQLVRENDILICARNGKLYEPASFGAFMAIYRRKFFEYILFYLRSDLFRNIFNKGNSTAINQLTLRYA